MDVNWRELRYIAIAGSIGGLLSWVYSQVDLEITSTGWWKTLEWWKVIPFALLGAGAAPMGVYILANVDMKAPARALIFAVACGFSWKPVLDASGALINQRETDRTDRFIDGVLETLQEPPASTNRDPKAGAEHALSTISDGLREVDRASFDKRLEFLQESRRALEDALKPLDEPTRQEYESRINDRLKERIEWKFRRAEK